jgi:hypothetical protein
MDATPRPRGPSGSDLLSGTPEAEAYCRTLAPAVFPDGVPSPELAARVADAIWRHLRDHPGPEPVVWDPADAAAQRISAAFQRDGLAAAFAEAARGERATAPPRLRVTAYREEVLP